MQQKVTWNVNLLFDNISREIEVTENNDFSYRF